MNSTKITLLWTFILLTFRNSSSKMISKLDMDWKLQNLYFDFMVSIIDKCRRERSRTDSNLHPLRAHKDIHSPLCKISMCLFSYDWLCTPNCCPIMTKHDIFGLLHGCHCQRCMRRLLFPFNLRAGNVLIELHRASFEILFTIWGQQRKFTHFCKLVTWLPAVRVQGLWANTHTSSVWQIIYS